MTSRILVAMRVPGPPERAFRIFTEEVGLWWQDNPLFRFTPRSPGTVAFEPPADGMPGRFVERLPDGKVFTVGDVTIWDAGHRLAFGWRQAGFGPDHRTEVEIRFEPVGDETRVTVEHRGWDSVPQAHVAKHGMPAMLFDQRHAEWWRTLLASLKGCMD
ncbi:SRPBCC domain-containing protein [Sphingomonas colocasiae]|uniref:SRPBCC domain-containing protein n=1 Tax=Sphingomonas colocasiae TaxID=1848973 RepID=A0ABS7PPC0_9SPHN|nr:SRPBCC domain-containing protein [Sphingomonas colocasiae]MBY8823164.1 SRPBCC domain-containing protein [Sphingomonas colocasiae]